MQNVHIKNIYISGNFESWCRKLKSSKNGQNFERFGLEAVPSSLKQSSWKEYTIIQLAFSVNAGNFLVPALAVMEGSLPWPYALTSVWLGSLLAFLCVSALSIPGALYGLPGQYILRSFVGSWLATKIASPIRVLTSLYWFSVQTIGGTYIVKSVLDQAFSFTIPFSLIAAVLASIMAFLALVGYNAVKKVTKTFLPILIIGQLLMLYVIFTNMPVSALTSVNGSTFSWLPFLFFMSLAFVQFVSGVSASSDMTRYAKTPRQGFYGMFIGNTLGYFMTAFIGTLVASLFQSINPFVALSSISAVPIVSFIIMLSGLLAMVSINIGNAYTGGFSLLNSLPFLGRIKSAILFGMLGIFFSCFPMLSSQASSIITLLGAGIIPLSAIIVTDYLWIKKGRISDDILLEVVSGSYKINRSAFITFPIMVIVYFFIPEQISPGLIIFVVSSLLYAFLKLKVYRK